MAKLLRVVRTFLSVYYAHMLEYRAEIFFWVLSGIFPFVLMGVWIKAAEGGQFSLTPLDFARYFFCVYIVRQLNVVWVIFDFEQEVVEGKLSPRLLQPIDPSFHYVLRHLAERGMRVILLFGLCLFFFVLYPAAFWLPKVQDIFLFSIVIVLSFFLRFLNQYAFSILTFWVERVTAIEQVWHLLYLFLSGIIAPYNVFPDVVREILYWTPFPYYVYFPAALLVGLPVPHLGRSILIMFAWTAFFYIISRWLWRQGLKQYSAMGA